MDTKRVIQLRPTPMEGPSEFENELLGELDAYGHMTYVVGFSDDFDEETDDPRGDWLSCFDFLVHRDAHGEVSVAYHVVVNSDSGGFIETAEQGVVPAAKAPLDLPDHWTSIGMDNANGHGWTEVEKEDAAKCQEKWHRDLTEALRRAEAGE